MKILSNHYQDLFYKSPLLELFFFLSWGALYAFIPSFIHFLLFLFFLYLSILSQIFKMQLFLFFKGFYLFYLGFLWTDLHQLSLPSWKEKKGSTLFCIEKKVEKTSFGHPSVVYTGYLKFLSCEETIYYKLPACYVSKKSSDFNFKSNVYFENISIQNRKGNFYIKLNKDSKINPISRAFSWAIWRWEKKKQLINLIEKTYKDELVKRCLAALATAELDSKLLKYHFSKAGLLHLLALSGFHFALVISVCSKCLSKKFLGRLSSIFLILLITFYFVYLGSTPSIERAYIAALLYLVGDFFDLQCQPLNFLGFAGLWTFFEDPFLLKNPGFQLSYLATFSLLYFSSSFAQKCLLWKRRFRVSQLIIKGAAVNLSVMTTSLPLMFYHFGFFPLMSLFFNLFFPALISLSMIFLLLGWILQSIPFCAFFLHRCNDLYTQALLKGVSDLPPFLYWDITLTSLTPTLTIFLITCGWCLTSLFFKGGKNLS